MKHFLLKSQFMFFCKIIEIIFTFEIILGHVIICSKGIQKIIILNLHVVLFLSF